jgi:hypothetical protein
VAADTPLTDDLDAKQAYFKASRYGFRISNVDVF